VYQFRVYNVDMDEVAEPCCPHSSFHMNVREPQGAHTVSNDQLHPPSVAAPGGQLELRPYHGALSTLEPMLPLLEFCCVGIPFDMTRRCERFTRACSGANQ